MNSLRTFFSGCLVRLSGQGRCLRLRARTGSSSRLRSTVYQALEARQLLAADAVLQWNELMLETIRAEKLAPPVASRALALLHTSIYNAVQAIDRGHHLYYLTEATPAHSKASVEAAVAAAGERVMSTLFPSRQAIYQAAYATVLDAVEDDAREAQGVSCGQWSADQLLSWRNGDGASQNVPFVSVTTTGVWRPTPPGFLPSALPQWPDVTPWSLKEGSQFRPEAPPALSTPEYAAALDEVMRLGRLDSLERTEGQTAIAKIWAGGAGTATPPGQWNMIAQDLSVRNDLSLVRNARLFALLNIGLADAAIAAWDAKYAYNLWRPITAIQEADQDGNDATTGDSEWQPLLTTPPFSAYISGHSTFSGAASTILSHFFGSEFQVFTLKSEVPGVADRSFSSLVSAAEEAGMSRIYGGIHFNFDNLQGLETGRQVGKWVMRHELGVNREAVARQAGSDVYLTGTRWSDHLLIERVEDQYVIFNKEKQVASFAADSVKHFYVNAGLGNDHVVFAATVVATAEILGGGGNDRLFGTQFGNWIYGEGGNDKCCGGAGADEIRGGNGNDRLFGLAGNDWLDAGEGENWLFGGADDDTLTGKRRKSRLHPGTGNDTLNWL